MVTENSIVVTKQGDLLCVVYNGGSDKYLKYTKNMVTREFVGLLLDDEGVETDLLSNEEDTYIHGSFDTINGLSITTNEILFTELEKEL